MVGGGQGAFIGKIHRMAAQLDEGMELVCGAFSSDPVRSRASGEALFLPPHRCYPDYETLYREEKKLPEGERMDFVVIVTPNHVHYDAASKALSNGFAVVSDKPATFNLKEAQALAEEVKQTGQLYCLTHNYSGYPMVKEARALVNAGKLGKIRKVVVEYPQGWLNESLESTGQKQASWRTDPSKAGAAGCLGDIGTHAEHLLRYTSGLSIKSLSAHLHTHVEGRALDDDVQMLLRLSNGGTGVLQASQIAVGEENALRIFIYGEHAGLEWHQMEPNTLIFKPQDAPAQHLRTGVGSFESGAASIIPRVPPGHPEGFIEAFANVYRGFGAGLRSHLGMDPGEDSCMDYPSIEDAVAGMAFVEAVLKSSHANAAWTCIQK